MARSAVVLSSVAAGVALGRAPRPRVGPQAARAALTPESADDAVLVERVGAALGRIMSHPHAISVSVADGKRRMDDDRATPALFDWP